MNSIKFPNMFSSKSINMIEGKDATKQNLKSLLFSEKGELFGDPYYGVALKKYLFEQNNSILQDILLDEIYTKIAQFMPQLVVKRKDVTFTKDNAKLILKIRALNKLDYTTDMYSLILFQEGEE